MKKLLVVGFVILILASASTARAQEPAAPAAPTPTAGEQQAVTLTAKEVRAVQQALFNRGYLVRQPSGVLDAATRQAIRDFQKAQNLDETGRIDTATLDKLGLSLPMDGPVGDSHRKRGVLSRVGYGIKDSATATGKAIGGTASKVGSGTKKGTAKTIEATSSTLEKGGDSISNAGEKSVEGAKDLKNKAVNLSDKVGTAIIGRSDADIHKDVRKVLNSRENTRYLQSEVKEGRVTLISTNSESEEVSQAVSEVRRIGGVKSVMVVQR